MLSEHAVQVLKDICAKEGNREVQQIMQKNPEEVLISLLEEIRKDLPDVSAMLKSTVQYGIHGATASSKAIEAEYAAKERAKK